MGNSKNMPAKKRRDRGPDIRALAKAILEEGPHLAGDEPYKNRSGAPGGWRSLDGLYRFTRPSKEGEELPIQPDKSSVWLEHHPSPRIQKQLLKAADTQLEATKEIPANKFGRLNVKDHTQGLKRNRESSDPENHRNQADSSKESPQTPLFDTGLYRWGLGPSKNAEIYDYYQRLDRKGGDDTNIAPESNISLLREVLEDDAHVRQENNNAKVSRWIRKREIARGGFSRVYLWEKKSIDGGPPLRMAVKDSRDNNFWQDFHAEGVLIRRLKKTGCKNVITVLDWLYRPASPAHDAFIRTCYEYAEHGDLEGIIRFYQTNQLVTPEAFIWHVFQNAANALCYCRHGTNKSNTTMPHWDPIVHGDVKPANLLLTSCKESTDSVYPTIKLGDFGVAYSIQESNPKLRAWKSTFRYGTYSFMAPEIETLSPYSKGNFRPVPPRNIHGSHSDIWSLGAVIEALMSTRFQAVKDHPNFDSPFVEEYYSARLQNLVARCKSYSIGSRPSIYNVYLRTQKAMAEWRTKVMEEIDHTPANRPSHSQVLFSKADQERFLQDRAFRNAYIKANRTPLLRGKTHRHYQTLEKENPPKPVAEPLSSKPPQNQQKPNSTQPSRESLLSKTGTAGPAKNLRSPKPSPSTQSSSRPILPPSNPPSLHRNITKARAAANLLTTSHTQSPTPTNPSVQSPAFILPASDPPSKTLRNTHSQNPTNNNTPSNLPPPKIPPPIPTQTKPRTPQEGEQQQQEEAQINQRRSKRINSRSAKEKPDAASRNREKRSRDGVAKQAQKESGGAARRSKGGKVERKVHFNVNGDGTGE